MECRGRQIFSSFCERFTRQLICFLRCIRRLIQLAYSREATLNVSQIKHGGWQKSAFVKYRYPVRCIITRLAYPDFEKPMNEEWFFGVHRINANTAQSNARTRVAALMATEPYLVVTGGWRFWMSIAVGLRMQSQIWQPRCAGTAKKS